MNFARFLLVGLFTSTLLWGQKSPKENEMVWLGFDVNIYANSTYYVSLLATQPGEGNPYEAEITTYNGLTTPSNRRDRVAVFPGRVYTMTVGANVWSTADVHFNAPPGYTMYVGYDYFTRTPMKSFQADINTMGNTYKVNIELRPDDGVSSLPAGFALPPSVNPVTWAVSLGRLISGHSAGTLRWRDSSISTDLLHGMNLAYIETDREVVYKEVFADGGIKFIDAPEVQARVFRNADPATGYTLSFYRWNADPGPNRDFPSDTPYASYTVSTPNNEAWANRVRITRVQDGKTETWTLANVNGSYTLEQSTNLRKILIQSAQKALAESYPGDLPGTTYRRERVTLTDGAGNNLASRVDRYYRDFGWNYELIREIADPTIEAGDPTPDVQPYTGLNLTTKYTYHTTGWSLGGAVSKLKSVTKPDGSWVRYDYYEDSARWGELAAVYRPWKDSSPADPASATTGNSQVSTFSYIGERSFYQDIPSSTQTTTMGTITARTDVTHAFWFNNDYNLWVYGDAPMRTETVQNYTASGAALTTIRKLFHSTIVPRPNASTPPKIANFELASKLYSQTNPDGTRISLVHFRGDFLDHLGSLTRTWDAASTSRNDIAGDWWCESAFNGASTAVAGSEAVTSWRGHNLEPVYMIPYRSTRRDAIRKIDGGMVVEADYLYIGSGSYKLISWKKSILVNGQLAETYDSTGARNNYSRIAGRVNFETLADGTKNEYFFDDLMQVTRVERKAVASAAGLPAQDAINTNTTYDAAGRVTSTSTVGAGGLTLSTSASFNLAGLPTAQTDERGLTTTLSYANGGRTITAVLPGGATKITDRWFDGQPKSVTGTAQVAQYNDISVDGSGIVTKTTYVGPGGASSPRWSRVYSDWAGRSFREEKPTSNPAVNFNKISIFNSSGQLTRVEQTNLANTLFVYDGLGQLEYSGLDMNANGTLDLASTDRITRSRTQVVEQGGTWWRQALTYIYNQDNTANAVTQSETLDRLVPYGGLVDDSNGGDFSAGKIDNLSRSYDIFRNETTRRTFVDRPAALQTTTTNVPDSPIDDVVHTLGGRKVRHQTAQNLTSNLYYDSLGRLTKQTDPRTDPNPTPLRIGYHTTGAGSIGQVAWRDDTAGNRTTFTYQSDTGRLAWSTDPLGKTAYHTYTLRGEPMRDWGSATYPVEYEYNDYGEQTKMRTWRDNIANFTDIAWGGLTYPSTTGDPTTWTYEASTGLLLSKKDADNKTVTYTYNPRGQLATRTWARGVTTTYSYSATTAEQTGIAYSDSTPNLGYAFNRLGQTSQIADFTGTRLIDHCVCGKIVGETLDAYFGGRKLTYPLSNLASGVAGRNIGVSLSGANAAGTDYSVTYGYDTYGRFNQLAAPGTGLAYTYNYGVTNSNLYSSISEASGWSETMTYESNRDLLASITGAYIGTSKAAFSYGHDTLGRRTSVVQSGEMFSRYQNGGIFTKWSYNDRSEVTAAQSYYGSNINDLSLPVAARNLTYAFDNIGSRTTSTVDGSATSYTNNALNQITSRTSPASTWVTGLAPTSATVKINGTDSGVVRQGQYYAKNVTAPATPPLWQTLAVESTLGGNSTRYSFLAATPESYTYDLDGNILDDGRWHYTWDAENRLTSMTPSAAAIAATTVNSQRQTISFAYDYLGRRVRKTVATWNGTAYATTLDRKFIYDGWNLIREVEATTLATLSSHYWGLDLSKTLQDGGGVGGLLATITPSGTILLPAYDANGNIAAMIDRSNGWLAAAFEYDAFGQTIRSTGAWATTATPFRFSTKYTDLESNLIYYGRRYYDPKTGRWLSRDPAEEFGGMHLYGFVKNNPIGKWDFLGMWGSDGSGGDPWAGFGSTDGSFVSSMTGSDFYENYGDIYTRTISEVDAKGLGLERVNGGMQIDVNTRTGNVDRVDGATTAPDKGTVKVGTPVEVKPPGRDPVFPFDHVSVASVGFATGIVTPVNSDQATDAFIDLTGLTNTPGLQAAKLIGQTISVIGAAFAGANAAPTPAPVTTGSRILTLDPSKYPIPVNTLSRAGALDTVLPVNRPAAPANRQAALSGLPRIPGFDLDEAPPAIFRNPGDPVLVQPTPSAQNRGAGASLGNQARSVPNGGTVIIVPKEKWPRQ